MAHVRVHAPGNRISAVPARQFTRSARSSSQLGRINGRELLLHRHLSCVSYGAMSNAPLLPRGDWAAVVLFALIGVIGYLLLVLL
ncbi:MAG TPA: hypothetical protein VFU71_12945 [Burkholderiaceae bacterium]|nr:hypothetical protein [Burkholderiaceae bacterium]